MQPSSEELLQSVMRCSELINESAPHNGWEEAALKSSARDAYHLVQGILLMFGYGTPEEAQEAVAFNLRSAFILGYRQGVKDARP